MRGHEKFIKIWKRFKAWHQGCRTCTMDGIQGSIISRFPELKPVEPLKFGDLYQCSRCGRSWFLHEHKQWLNRIDENSLPLVRQWNHSRLTVDTSILNTLASIGGVEEHYKGYIAIPCCAQDVSGQKHERAIVLVSKQPPFGWPEPQTVHWSYELAAVTPSPFALPVGVRRASSEKREDAMGFAPVGVVDKRGKEYTLGCQSHFLDSNGIKGEELSLSGRQKEWRNVVWPKPAQAFYFVDWFDRYEQLLAQADAANAGGKSTVG